MAQTALLGDLRPVSGHCFSRLPLWSLPGPAVQFGSGCRLRSLPGFHLKRVSFRLGGMPLSDPHPNV